MMIIDEPSWWPSEDDLVVGDELGEFIPLYMVEMNSQERKISSLDTQNKLLLHRLEQLENIISPNDQSRKRPRFGNSNTSREH